MKKEEKGALKHAMAKVDYFETDEVLQYFKDCASLAWKMVIQRPPMYFEAMCVGEAWVDDGSTELMWGSNPKAADAKIVYYKNPSLFYRNNAMVNATVFVHNQSNA